MPERLTIASRGSRLARAQAAIVAELVRREHGPVEVAVTAVTTRGDRDRRAFGVIGGTGLFTTEVEREVVQLRADVAVHSAKDVTGDLARGCSIVCIPARGPVNDVVVGGGHGTGEQRLGSLPADARVGTSSVRRRALLAEARPDLDAVGLRGNLDTRLRRIARGAADVAVLAAAGLARLELDAARRAGPLDPTWWIPAPGQGALAVEALDERGDVAELFRPLVDRAASAEVACERAFAARLQGGCSVPLGCLARAEGATLSAWGLLGSPEEGRCLRDRISGPIAEAEVLGRELADAILDAGGHEVLEHLGETATVEPSPP